MTFQQLRAATVDGETVRLLSPSEVAEWFRVTPRTITDWTVRGRLPVHDRTPGGHARYLETEIRRLADLYWRGIRREAMETMLAAGRAWRYQQAHPGTQADRVRARHELIEAVDAVRVAEKQILSWE